MALQQSENDSNVRETQSMLLERIASEMNRLKFYMAHAKVSLLSSLALFLCWDKYSLFCYYLVACLGLIFLVVL